MGAQRAALAFLIREFTSLSATGVATIGTLVAGGVAVYVMKRGAEPEMSTFRTVLELPSSTAIEVTQPIAAARSAEVADDTKALASLARRLPQLIPQLIRDLQSAFMLMPELLRGLQADVLRALRTLQQLLFRLPASTRAFEANLVRHLRGMPFATLVYWVAAGLAIIAIPLHSWLLRHHPPGLLRGLLEASVRPSRRHVASAAGEAEQAAAASSALAAAAAGEHASAAGSATSSPTSAPTSAPPSPRPQQLHGSNIWSTSPKNARVLQCHSPAEEPRSVEASAQAEALPSAAEPAAPTAESPLSEAPHEPPNEPALSEEDAAAYAHVHSLLQRLQHHLSDSILDQGIDQGIETAAEALTAEPSATAPPPAADDPCHVAVS